MPAQLFELEILPTIPAELQRLEELAQNLWYSWDAPTRGLFKRLDSKLWIQVGHSPRLFLRNIEQQRLLNALDDPFFMDAYRQVLAAYDHYHQAHERHGAAKQLADDDLIAYFCAEYGFHESLPVYSGGLGILAGDHCKTASDLRLPFIGVGLYYHMGYFSQLIDSEGTQIVTHITMNPLHSPISPVLDENGELLVVSVKIANKDVFVKAWQVKIGHIRLYLLDTALEQNSHEDREITNQLYGGDQHMRIKQEIILGIAGVKVLRRLGLNPTVWHMNEGHAAFLVLERLREKIAAGSAFADALETIAASTVFTTHTPVPAGHDHFSPDVFLHYLGSFAQELHISADELLSLGRLPHDHQDFNMTTLAIHGSRKMNGVSRIHGGVSSEICAKYWAQISPKDNPMSYVTNGVHVPTFLAKEWSDLFDKLLGNEWRYHLTDKHFWQRIDSIFEPLFWSVKQGIKTRMLRVLRNSLISQYTSNQISAAHTERMLRFINPDNPNILTVGFARRFATYKRATLLFKDVEWLRSILNDEKRPVVFIFAGKAHPADRPGQELLKQVHALSMQPEFVGKILLVQGYDMGLARRLVAGVDVWLNTPVYPMEASGTSGMKAAINATINLSVLDGWWAESFDGENGWGIRPSPHHDVELRDRDDARTLYELLQDDVIPLYYNYNQQGYSPEWVKKAKRSMSTVLPQFNMVRMLNDYIEKIYIPASQQGNKLRANEAANAKILAAWKAKIRTAWHQVAVRHVSSPPAQLAFGKAISVEVVVFLAGLEPQDLCVELQLSRKVYHAEIVVSEDHHSSTTDDADTGVTHQFVPERALENGEYLYRLSFNPEWCGGLNYQIRVFPHHELLTHPHEMGMML
jgi:starch phosphorylase